MPKEYRPLRQLGGKASKICLGIQYLVQNRLHQRGINSHMVSAVFVPINNFCLRRFFAVSGEENLLCRGWNRERADGDNIKRLGVVEELGGIGRLSICKTGCPNILIGFPHGEASHLIHHHGTRPYASATRCRALH